MYLSRYPFEDRHLFKSIKKINIIQQRGIDIFIQYYSIFHCHLHLNMICKNNRRTSNSSSGNSISKRSRSNDCRSGSSSSSGSSDGCRIGSNISNNSLTMGSSNHCSSVGRSSRSNSSSGSRRKRGRRRSSKPHWINCFTKGIFASSPI